MLDFEALRKTTAPPNIPVYTRAARAERHATLRHVLELGVSENVIANMCLVDLDSVRRWQKEGGSPHRYLGRRAFDRLGPVVRYMQDELGLTDESIASFLNTEPRNTQDRSPGDDAYWHKPLVTRIGVTTNMFPYPFLDNPPIDDGLKAVQQRLELRFPERCVELQAGIIATPQTVR